jgi:hypothetical protein
MCLVAGDARMDRVCSGHVLVADVGGGFKVAGASSGEVDVSDVAGTVRLPERD